MIDLKQLEAWFVTGSQGLYGKETLDKVAEHAREIARELSASAAIPVTVVFKPVVTLPGRHPRGLPGGQLREELHRPGDLDAHLLPGEDVDRRAFRAAPSRLPTCTRSTTATSPGRPSTWTS